MRIPRFCGFHSVGKVEGVRDCGEVPQRQRPLVTSTNKETTTRKTDTRTRIECTNWDDEVAVATWARGRARKPARKVLTKGVVKVELTKGQMSRITKMLGSGMEVRLDFGGDGAIRLYPCAAADFKTMFVAADTMGEFRHAVYRGRNLAFTSRRGRRSVSREEVEERVERVEAARQERSHVTPETVVECPKCGFEFKVGKSLK